MALCCFPDCREKVTTPHVTCGAHWRGLPPQVKAAAQERIRGWRKPEAAREFIAMWLKTSNAKGARQL